jgi:hypothetical protein
MQDVAQEKKVLGCSPALTSGVRLLKMERPTLILVAPPEMLVLRKANELRVGRRKARFSDSVLAL